MLDDVEKLPQATTCIRADRDYFRGGGGFSSNFRQKEVCLRNMMCLEPEPVRPHLQIAVVMTVEIRSGNPSEINMCADPTWPVTWFVNACCVINWPKHVYSVMNKLGAPTMLLLKVHTISAD